ncbi:RRXRR domain-containing protein [Lusitaniella coriacea]|uniref:RRXRR domain-containing protein n=1 Tax=Lusitaniella coriacea TaxID=1983105 RepID=UPI003CE96FC2
MQRVPVISKDGTPLMPAKPSRVRRWLRDGNARVFPNDLGVFAVQLLFDTGSETQDIAIGIDPGKKFTGVAVQSAKVTLWMGHLNLPFSNVRKRMEQRAMMRRGRRGRRIDRKLPFSQRAHRQKRFDNRKQSKIPPSIRANRELELRVFDELIELFPVEAVCYEIIKASGSRGFSPVMVGQHWMLERFKSDYTSLTVLTQQGWETSNLRQYLNLPKEKKDKSKEIRATHATDAIALAASHFTQYKQIKGLRGWWEGSVQVSLAAPFAAISRPPVSRRQLHLMVPSKGGLRRKYGGTVTRHGFRKGDFVEATKAGLTDRGWVSGDTKTQVSVSDANWKRIGQFTARKVRLLKRNTGLICKNTYGGDVSSRR